MFHFHRPQFAVFSTFTLHITAGIVLSVAIPLLAQDYLHASPQLLGYYGFALGLGFIVVCFFSGRLSDRYGRRPILILALLTYVAALLLMLAIPLTPGLFYIPVVLAGAANGFFWPVIEAAMSDQQRPRQIKQAMGIFNMTWVSGMMLGPVVGAQIFFYSPTGAIFTALGTVVVVLIALGMPHSMQIADWGKSEALTHERLVPIAKRKQFIKLAFIANFTAFFMLISFRSLLPAFTNPAGIIGWRFGLLAGAPHAGMLFANILLIRWHGWHYSLPMLLLAEIAAALVLFVFVTTSAYPVLLLSAFVVGFPAGLAYFSSIFYGMEQMEKKGAHGSNHEFILGIGEALGPLAGGMAIAWTGFTRQNLTVCAALFLLAALIQIAIVRRVARPKGIPISRTSI